MISLITSSTTDPSI